MKVSILIKNGHILDPAREVDGVGDIAIKNGRIIDIPYGESIEAEKTIDASGKYVSPGFIDSHCHIFYNSSFSSVPIDLSTIPAGVTFGVDQGSSGLANYKLFLSQLNNAIIHSKIYLHVAATGQICTRYKPEPYVPENWDRDSFREAFDFAGDKILGLKLRVSKNAVFERGLTVLYEAAKLRDDLHTNLYIHVNDPDGTQSEVINCLKEGDVYGHAYHGSGSTIYENDKIADAIYEARKRGVLIDAAHGYVNYSNDVAVRAFKDGFYPDLIGSDTIPSSFLSEDAFNLPYVLSWLMACGMSLKQVITCVTKNAAKYVKMDGLVGTLASGTEADVVVYSLQNCEHSFTDYLGKTVIGSQMIVPELTVRRGAIVYRSINSII